MKYYISLNNKLVQFENKESAEEILLKIPEDKRKNIRILSEEEYNKEFGKKQEQTPKKSVQKEKQKKINFHLKEKDFQGNYLKVFFIPAFF